MTSKLTRERIEWLNYAATGLAANGTEMAMSPQDVIALTECCLAAMDCEPVAWTDAEELSDLKRDGYAAMLSLARKYCKHADPRRQILLFTHLAPSRQRDQVRNEHAKWSQATFGDVGPVGPLKHLSKEALEAAAEPGDLSEWADMQFLLWDAQRRAGITDEQITQAMTEKLAVNKQREWPEPKEGEPRLHIKEQPAPVVDADNNFYSWFGREWQENYQHNQYTTAAKQMLGVMAESAWKAGHRAAMLQELQKSAGDAGDVQISRGCRSNENMQDMEAGNSSVIGIDPASGPDRTMEVRYVAPPGYVMVPKDLLSALRDWAHPEIEKYCEMWEGRRDSEFPALRKVTADADALLAAGPQPQNAQQNIPEIIPGWIPVSERMPEDRMSVILWDAEIGEVTSGHYSHKAQMFYHCGDAIENEITHWMQPPAGPQEVKGE